MEKRGRKWGSKSGVEGDILAGSYLVWVILHGQFTEGFLNLLQRCSLLNPQQGVIILSLLDISNKLVVLVSVKGAYEQDSREEKEKQEGGAVVGRDSSTRRLELRHDLGKRVHQTLIYESSVVC